MDLPADAQLRWILRHTATLLQQGAEPVSGLVLPTGEFFPDTFDGSPEAVAVLLKRVQMHAGLADLSVDLTIVLPEGETLSVGCSSGACGGTGKIEAKLDRVARRTDGSYEVKVGAAEVKSPVVLMTGLVRAVSFMFLTEADGYAGTLVRDREPLTDLAAVLLGFGVLMANGAYIYMKGCGGVKVHSVTRMPVDELTVALAVFCRLHEVPERGAARHLELTQSEHFDEAVVWARSNASVVKMLRKSPAAIERDEYTLSPARSWLARALGVGAKKRARSADEELAELERALGEGAPSSARRQPVDAAKAKKLAELRALVDESLEG